MYSTKKKLTVGLIILFITTTLFYITTRPKPTSQIPVIFPTPFEIHTPAINEKYLSYLPHSGFHNQRIELENALLLATYLNRTLLVPPVMLANPAMPWLKYPKLYERLLFQSKHGLEHCVTIEGGMPLPSECLNSFRYTNIPWSFFYDMKKVQQQSIPVVFRDSLSYEWIYRHLQVKHKEIYFFRDLMPYEYQIHDDTSTDLPLDRFNYRIQLNTLKKIEHPVLHFGSMFGSYRILAETEEHVNVLRKIRSNMIFSHPVLTEATNRIVQQLGHDFIGLHIRVGDGIFKLRASILVDDIFHALVNEFTDLTLEEVLEFDPEHDKDRTESSDYEVVLRSMPVEANHTKPIEIHHPTHYKPPTKKTRLSCQPSNTFTRRFQHTVLYIATDAPNPRHHPLLRKLFKLFPCTFVLSDFEKEWKEVKKLQVVEEKVSLEGYLIPMLDAMIAAHGHTFFGTPHSTFSSYIERQLNPVYTGKQVQVMGLKDYLKQQ
ncbi:hypothetical protein G6F57_001471 [Rhizopus arrhizus]|nr:hypothetical protein G6F24_000808 [Rhizopus arrhizus]KAG1416390.1 hypothetical protein G6F58_006000 [Rhizopus delemar]KAG0796529.1 hypothetical protein G6F21_001242 [Rhizopus arrhizus]KAG0798899.1 hypothetical protein G6F22_003762 [Rhizopus arrhizus]KAG0818299.1 hypothetical protein G6F20_001680 [Rhizopus arrhizus]